MGDRKTGRETSERLALALGLASAFVGGYFGLAAWTDGARAVSVRLPVDDSIPLVVGSVWVYATVYTALLVPLFVVRSIGLLRRVAAAYAFVLAVTFTGFVLFPVSAAELRAPASMLAGQGFTAWGMRLVYALDPPWNCFPSLHMGIATVVALVVARNVPRGAWVSGLWWIALAISTATTRQHYVLDVVAGGGIGALAAAMALRGQPRDPRSGGWPGLGRYAVLHTLVVGALYLAHRLGA